MANEFYSVMPTKAFEAQLRQLPQSTKTILPYCTNMGDQTGEEAYFNQAGSMTARKGRVRYGNHEKDEGVFKRRRVTPEFAYLATELDCKDQVESLVDPRSSLSMNVKYALSRTMGQDTITNAFGTAYTGKAGGTSEAYNAAGTDVIAAATGAAASTGMNADKLVGAIELIQNQGLDLSDPATELTLDMAPKQSSDAKLDSVLSNYDYLTSGILAGLEVPDGFMGIKNVMVDPMCPYANNAATGVKSSWTDNGLAQDDTDANDVRMAFLFIKSAIGYSMWEQPTVKVDELQQQHYDWQLYSRVQYGMTRMYAQGGIIGILCDESPA